MVPWTYSRCRLLWSAAAWLVAAVPAAHAGLFDSLLGGDDMGRCLTPLPADGLVPEPLVSRASLTWTGLNGLPLDLRRNGQPWGRLRTGQQNVGLTAPVGHSRLDLSASASEVGAAWLPGTRPGRVDRHDQTLAAALTVPLTPALRAVVGYDQGHQSYHLQLDDASLQPDSNGKFELDARSARAKLGLGYQTGRWELGAGGAAILREGALTTQIRNSDASFGLNAMGWACGAQVASRSIPGWNLRLGGSMAVSRRRNSVFVDTSRHGRDWPDSEEWRVGLEADGRLGPRVTWWGTLFHRDLRLGLRGNATALAPPLGAFLGPRFDARAGFWQSDTGIATTVTWQATRRTTLTAGARLGVGRCVGEYQVVQYEGAAAPDVVSQATTNQDLTLAFLSLAAEQRFGTTRVGLRMYAPLPLLHDRAASGGGGGGQSSVHARLTVPVAVTVGWDW